MAKNYSDENSYTFSHRNKDHVDSYDEYTYGKDTYDNRVWNLEKQILKEIIDRHYADKTAENYLDFACGTGRICEFMEKYVDNSVGMDVSEEMVSRANKKCKKTNFVIKDFYNKKDIFDMKFDIITAFRFFLNAEQKLKNDAFKFLKEQLRGDGLLILNVHGNKYSMRHIPFVVRHVITRGKHCLNEMSVKDVEKLCEKNGMEIKELHPVSFLPTSTEKLLSQKQFENIEKLFAKQEILKKNAVDIIFVIGYKNG